MIPKSRIPLLLTCFGLSTALADVPVIPRPVSETLPNGSELSNYAELAKTGKAGFMPGKSMNVTAPEGLANEKGLLDSFFKTLSNLPKEASGNITLSLDSSLKDDAYELKVHQGQITIKGGGAAGVFYATQTLKQLLLIGQSRGNWAIPDMTIKDEPMCQWRGVMLDSARHFKSKEFMKKFIDVMALYKLNRMHWHLVDSEGWRLEIKKYPKLVQVAESFPAEYPSEDPTDKSRPAHFMYGHFHGGGYYTQEDIKEVVAYAKARHIEIIPEIEFPGHMMIALTAYPEFSTTGKVPTVRSNISPDLLAVNDKAMGFFKDILDETMALFPFEVIHFGGDEAPKGQWKNSREAQDKMKELGFTDENELQAWMFNEFAAHVKKKGKRPMGWEEIMHGKNIETLTKDALIMPWLSGNNAVKAVNAGFAVIHCQVGPFYFDSYQTNSPADNWTLYGGPFTLESVYKFNLFPRGLKDEAKKLVYGAQAQLWAELMPRTENVEYQAFPRLNALAELTWTPENRKDYQDFYKRLLDHASVLDAYKINYRYIDPLPVATWDSGTLNNKTMTIELPKQTVDRSKGEMIVKLDFKGGASGLNIKKVELVSDGKVIASDEHDGFAGTKTEDNTYRLKFPNKAYARMSLKVTHGNTANEQNSNGEITVYYGKGLALFDPRNFRGGDYPSASWTTGDTKENVSSVRIPMDGLVKKPGNYELLVTIKQSKAPVIVGAVSVVGTRGAGTKFKEVATLDEGNKTAILPITLKEADIQAGNSLSLNIKSAQPSTGDIRVRSSRELPSRGEKKYGWDPDTFKGGSIVAYANNVDASADGEISVQFNYTGGGNGLDVAGVQVVENGVVIAESSEKGFAGANPKGNQYTLKSPKIKPGKKYSLRMSIAGSGGNDTHGVVTVE